MPSRTPSAVVARINKDMNAALATPELRDALTRQGLEPRGGTSADFSKHVRGELVKWARVVKDADLRMDN